MHLLVPAVLAAAVLLGSAALGAPCSLSLVELASGTSLQCELRPGAVLEGRLRINNTGTICTKSQCYDGDRYARIDAHTQRERVVLTMSLYQPVASSPAALLNRTSGIHTGLVGELGTWSNTYQNGDCFGDLSRWAPHPGREEVYFRVELEDPNAAATVLVYAASFDGRHPIPGGCTSFSPFRANPVLTAKDDGAKELVNFDGANIGVSRYFSNDQPQLACPCHFVENLAVIDSSRAVLQHTIYEAHVSECGSSFKRDYDEGPMLRLLERMSGAAGVRKFGTPVSRTLYLNKPTLLSTLIQPGQGVVYNVLVHDVAFSTADDAVYTPYGTYGCSLSGGRDQCSSSAAWYYTAGAVLLCVFSLVVMFAGLRYFTYTIIYFSFIFFLVVGVLIANQFKSSVALSVQLFLHSMFAIMGTAVHVICLLRFNTIGYMLVFLGTILGFFITSFLFATHFGEFTLWESDLNFSMAFACLTMLWPVFLLLIGRILTITASSVGGTYLFLFGVDFFVGSDFMEITTNVVRRSSTPGFGIAYSGNFFADEFNGCANYNQNMTMLVMWVIFSMLCGITQYYVTGRESKLPTSSRPKRFPRRQNRVQQIFAPAIYDDEEELEPLVAGSINGRARPQSIYESG
eukprot:m.152359 g.152359  ORF g.152359 m.152359 type:complete len:630 (-) comp10161_c0_seq3:691-2580(-)